MNIYIIAPDNRVSGGPELAHQLCSAINELTEFSAYMCYVTTTKPYKLAVDTPAPAPYTIYNTTHATDISLVNNPDSVVVVPEGLTPSMPMIPLAQKVLWWMSVDNYIKSTNEENLTYIRDNVLLHLFQSHYSSDYVNRKMPGVKGIFLSDYINEAHGKFIYPAEFRHNIALYNPAKGYSELKPLIDKTSWLEWVPIKNMEVEKVVFMMQASKIYVDFGEHPGKDRIPREAAANGCCIITNRKGSAAFAEDVPIPDQFKFDDPSSNLEKINSLMHKICDDFKTYQDKFSDYRDFIKSEKQLFEKDTLKFTDYLKNNIQKPSV